MEKDKFLELKKEVDKLFNLLYENNLTACIVAIDANVEEKNYKAFASLVAPDSQDNWDEFLAFAFKEQEKNLPELSNLRQKIINSDTQQTCLKPTYRVWYDKTYDEWKIQRKGIKLWHDVSGMISKDKNLIINLANSLKALDHQVEGL